MEESQFEAQKRQEVIRMYQACKEALQIITDANLDGLQMDQGFVYFYLLAIVNFYCLDVCQSILLQSADDPFLCHHQVNQCLRWLDAQVIHTLGYLTLINNYWIFSSNASRTDASTNADECKLFA